MEIPDGRGRNTCTSQHRRVADDLAPLLNVSVVGRVAPPTPLDLRTHVGCNLLQLDRDQDLPLATASGTDEQVGVLRVAESDLLPADIDRQAGPRRVAVALEILTGIPKSSNRDLVLARQQVECGETDEIPERVDLRRRAASSTAYSGPNRPVASQYLSWRTDSPLSALTWSTLNPRTSTVAIDPLRRGYLALQAPAARKLRRVGVERIQGFSPTGIPFQPFTRPGWIYEEKVDGWRILAYKDGARVRLVRRNGVDHARRERAGWRAGAGRGD